MTTCKNCNHPFEGPYCNHCRQAAATARITWKEVFVQLRRATVDVDSGFLFTARELFLRPGTTIQHYLDGKRVNYANPFFYVLLLAGFGSILFLTFDVPLPVRSIHLESIERTSPFMAEKYFIIVGLFIISIMSLTDWILHRGVTYNFSEIVVANTFQAGQVLVITILIFPLLYLQDHYFPPSTALLDIRQALKLVIFYYFVQVRYQLFSPLSQRKVLLLMTILVQVVSIILLYEFVIAGIIVRMM